MSDFLPNRWSYLLLLLLLCSNDLFAPDAPLPVSAHNPSEPGNSRLTVLSWNIAMLPLLDMVKTVSDRAERIGMALAGSKYDIILFQEAFTGHARRAIYRKLKRYFPFQYGPANSRTALRINSGLWVLSQIPLTVVREYQFSASGGLDQISRKGAILLEGEFNRKAFQVIGTHLDSNEIDPTVRFKQLEELNDNLINPFTKPEIPMIICGDFNTDRDFPEQYGRILRILECEDGNLAGDEKNTFGFLNDQDTLAGEKPRQLDYIFTKNSTCLKYISRKVSIIAEPLLNRLMYLSDHHGIEASIHFK